MHTRTEHIYRCSDLNRRSGARLSARARRGSSASLKPQAARFKEAPPGRSPEPRRQALRASARVNPGDRTRLLALVRSFALVGLIEPTNAAIYLSLLNPNPHLDSGLHRCISPPSLLLPERPRAWFGRLDYIVDTITAVVPLHRHHCSRCCSLSLLQSLLLATVTAAACHRSLLPLATVTVTAAPLAFS
ncbi:hypothetical protein BHE74_00022137 [Ensete ventricosum]|nr:hypothetical protein BHE74_00022137 [Ensete ventricosum]